jgi:hypothetical protein
LQIDCGSHYCLPGAASHLGTGSVGGWYLLLKGRRFWFLFQCRAFEKPTGSERNRAHLALIDARTPSNRSITNLPER